MEIKQLFSSPFAFFQNKDLLNDLKQHIYEQDIKGVESNCAIKLKKNLVESTFNFFNSEEIIIKKTVKFIARSFGKFLNQLHNEDCHYDITFNESWFHVGKKNSVHETHSHAMCSWCGIYFVQAGDEGSGDTVFCNPVVLTHQDVGLRQLASTSQERVLPKDGLLVFFPSYLRHHQSLYTGDKDRIVVAFNISVTGIL